MRLFTLKIMCAVFWDRDIFVDFLPQDSTVQLYIMKRLRNHVMGSRIRIVICLFGMLR